MVEEVVFANRAHIGADAFAGAAVELFQGDASPPGGCLHHLGVDGVLVAIVRNMALDRRARAVAVQHIADAAFDIDD